MFKKETKTKYTIQHGIYPLINFTQMKPLNQPIRNCKLFHFRYASVIEVTQLLKKRKRKKEALYDDLPPNLL